MGYSDALIGYLAAYNAKAELEKNPLLESGVIEKEQEKLSGHINISTVANYDRALNEIESVLPDRIAQYQATMDSYKEEIIRLFGTMHTIDVTMETGQRITVNEGVIQVITPEL